MAIILPEGALGPQIKPQAAKRPPLLVPTRKGYLYVDLVPSSAWYTNLRSAIAQSDWDLIRHTTYQAAGHRCEICGRRGQKHPVECHERWTFVDGTQKLVGTEALCPNCHEATHFGLALVKNRDDHAFSQLMLVNGWSAEKTRGHINEAFDRWGALSKQTWRLDMRWIHGFEGLSPKTLNSLAIN